METLLYYLPALESVRDFIELGGEVLIAIGLLTMFMWALIIERTLYFWFTFPDDSERLVRTWRSRSERASWYATQIRQLLLSRGTQLLERHVQLIRTCVALCPLLGLLGTVTGMVEVFEVMTISGSGDPRSVAAGVSKATISTMAGLVAALSGVAMSAWLQKQVINERRHLRERLHQ